VTDVKRKTRQESAPDAIRIPAADGYRYADDHLWGLKKQDGLVQELLKVEEELASGGSDRTIAGKQSA
jgi:hypothetical protein